MNVDDVFLVLHHHWVQDTTIFPDRQQLLQVAFLVLISAYTATRPRALVYVLRNIKEYKRSPIKESNKDNDKDKDKDKDKNTKVGKGNDNKDIVEGSYKDKSNKDNNTKADDYNKDKDIDDATANVNLASLDLDDLVKTICYEDVNLILLSNLTRTHNLLALKINLWYTKRH
jgi:hypothetical protein